MTINPIIPIWIMAIICVVLLLFKRKGVFPYIRQIIAIALLFAINLRVMVPDGTVTYKKQEINTSVLLIVDTTISMIAQDYNGTNPRLDAVKADCNYIIDKLDGARISVMTFDNEARMLSPFTDDSQFARSSVASISTIKSLYARGSSINTWHDLAKAKIKEAAEKNNGKIAVFFFSDGEITTNETLDSFKDMAEYIDYGAVFGYGTEKGGKMMVQEWSDGEVETIQNRETWEDGISKIDEKNLKAISKDLGVDYYNRNDKSSFDPILDSILASSNTSAADKEEVGYKDIYYIFVIPFIILAMFEYIEIKRKR